MKTQEIEKKTTRKQILNDLPKPTKLNKLGEWAKANPGGWFIIKDMKAVMK